MTQVEVLLTSAKVTVDGVAVALVEHITIGGGEQVVTVDGVPEVRIHPTSTGYHVRLLAPDRMVSDQLLQTDTWEEALELARRYAALRLSAAGQVAKLADSLRM